MGRQFENRTVAGKLLGEELKAYANRPEVIVVALPRGGVPVAYEVAQALHAPLDILVVRKLGVPGQEELAMGAIASGGFRVINESVTYYLNVSDEMINRVALREQRELERRERLYRGERPPLDVRGRIVILVDDGLATGSTMRAAVRALKQLHPAEIVVAVPVAARSTCDEFRTELGIPCVCWMTPERFEGVGLWYRDFSQTTDEEVRALLGRAMQTETLTTA